MNSKTNENGKEHGRKRGIRILRHNMQRFRTVPHEIRAQMGANGHEILLTQEPHNIDGKIPGLGTGVANACRGSKYGSPMAAVGVNQKI